MSSDWPFTWEGTASIPSPLRTVCGHTETRVALLTPGVGKLSCRIHWRGAATNRAMPYVLACAGETKVSTAEGGSEGRLQPQSEGRSGFTHLHQTLQKCHWPQAMAKRLGRSLSILVPGSRKAISLPRWHSYELYLPRCKGCTPAHSGFPPN